MAIKLPVGSATVYQLPIHDSVRRLGVKRAKRRNRIGRQLEYRIGVATVEHQRRQDKNAIQARKMSTGLLWRVQRDPPGGEEFRALAPRLSQLDPAPKPVFNLRLPLQLRTKQTPTLRP